MAPPNPSANRDVVAPHKPSSSESKVGEAEKLPSNECRLLAIGDSLTDPKSGGGRYLKTIEVACHCEITNLGKGGDMVNQMKARLFAHFSTLPPRYDYVLIFGGVNDLYSDETAHRTVEKISRDLEEMFRISHLHGAQVISLAVTPWGGFRRFYNERRGRSTLELNAFLRQGATRGLTDVWVDAYSELSCGDRERLCDRYAAPHRDGLHFGPLGHERLGRAIAQALGTKRCPDIPDDGSNPPL
jgi:lysophospholipase L1-like esterase